MAMAEQQGGGLLRREAAEYDEDLKWYMGWKPERITWKGTGGCADREVTAWIATKATLFCNPFDPALNCGAVKQDWNDGLVASQTVAANAAGMVDQGALLHYRAVEMSFDQFSLAAIDTSQLTPYVHPAHTTTHPPQSV